MERTNKGGEALTCRVGSLPLCSASAANHLSDGVWLVNFVGYIDYIMEYVKKCGQNKSNLT